MRGYMVLPTLESLLEWTEAFIDTFAKQIFRVANGRTLPFS